MNKRHISQVYKFGNGMCMVFDQFGEQMPEYQGTWSEVGEKIVRDKPEHVDVQQGEWTRYGGGDYP